MYRLACVIMALVAICMSGGQGVNTRIGWPNQFVDAGGWTLACYLAVWGLVLIAVVVMVQTTKRQEGGPLLSTVALLAVAVLILQWLPPTDHGVQFIPLSPWAYSGWISFGVSLLCWICILLAVYLTVDRLGDSPSVFSSVCLFAMSLNALLSFSELKTDRSPDSASSEQLSISQGTETSESPLGDGKDYEREVAAWRKRASRLRAILYDLRSARRELDAPASGNPGTSSSEHPELDEALELDGQIALVEHELEALETAIEKAESRLRRIERHELLHETVGDTDVFYGEIFRTERELQEALRRCQNDVLTMPITRN